MSFGLFQQLNRQRPSRSSSWQACRRWRRCRRGAPAQTGCSGTTYRPPPSCCISQASSPHHIVLGRSRRASCCSLLDLLEREGRRRYSRPGCALALAYMPSCTASSMRAGGFAPGCPSETKLFSPLSRRTSTHWFFSMSFGPELQTERHALHLILGKLPAGAVWSDCRPASRAGRRPSACSATAALPSRARPPCAGRSG